MNLEERIKKIEERNTRVEGDKAWETSVFRKMLITVVTYIIAGLVLVSIGNDDPFMNSLIPSIGYLLSTLSLPSIKRFWINRAKQKGENYC